MGSPRREAVTNTASFKNSSVVKREARESTITQITAINQNSQNPSGPASGSQDTPVKNFNLDKESQGKERRVKAERKKPSPSEQNVAEEEESLR